MILTGRMPVLQHARDTKKRPRPFKPSDFNPHERKTGAKLGIAELKEMLEGEGK